VSQYAIHHFGRSATSYYVAGRFAVKARLSPVAADLLHQAIEMFLKSGLSRHLSLIELARFSHRLPELWAEFKLRFPEQALQQHDAVIATLNDFEELRYRERTINPGVEIRIGMMRPRIPEPSVTEVAAVPEYKLYVSDIDTLVRHLLAAAGLNREYFSTGLSALAYEYLGFKFSH
jgi:hypothetical protein